MAYKMRLIHFQSHSMIPNIYHVGVTPVAAHVSVSYATQSIVDGVVERDRRKKTFVVYNLPEAKDREADKLSALSLVKLFTV